MIVEVRTYTVKSGRREEFLELFQTRTKPLQRSLGIGVIGPWIDLEDRDRFVWLRSFPSLEERERMKRALYEGEEWTSELEAIAMPLLDEFTSVVIEIDECELPGIAPPDPVQKGHA